MIKRDFMYFGQIWNLYTWDRYRYLGYKYNGEFSNTDVSDVYTHLRGGAFRGLNVGI